MYCSRVVEVVWDAPASNWKMLRFRDDKTEGNYKDVVTRILLSIRDGVEQEALIERAGMIKQGWRQREAIAIKKHEEEKKRMLAIQQQQQRGGTATASAPPTSRPVLKQ